MTGVSRSPCDFTGLLYGFGANGGRLKSYIVLEFKLTSELMKSKSSILIYRHGSLGDTIVALPVLHAIARTFPTARRVILTKRRTNQKAAQMSEVLDGTGLVHGYIEYSDDTSSWELYHRIR